MRKDSLERGKNIRLQVQRPQYRPNVLFDLLKEKGNAFWQKMLEREKDRSFPKARRKARKPEKTSARAQVPRGFEARVSNSSNELSERNKRARK